MKLTKVRVELFENIVDSTEVEIDPDVTCLVGKNESGKTAFLRALCRLNPAHESGTKFVPRDDYPRWRWRRDDKEGRVNSAKPIWAAFELDDTDVAVVEKEFGSGALASRTLSAWRTYANDLILEAPVDEGATVQHLVAQLPDGSPARRAASKARTLEQLQAALEKAKATASTNGTPPQPSPPLAGVEAVEKRIKQLLEAELSRLVALPLRARFPKFFYFGQYSYLPGRVALGRLLSTAKEQLKESETTALALLELAGGTKESLTAEDYEQRVAELEASGNEITRQVLEYWTTNPDIRVDFDIDKKIEPQGPQNQPQVVERYLEIRLHDERHQFTTNFETRSTGFRWLFSFIAAFSAFEDRPEGVVVLLDEPALNLHAKAQADFLRFINERLAARHQVLYTTHSPFMVEPDRLRRVRLVEDKKDEGAQVSSDVLSTDKDTLFPLQAALGYDLSQNLFVGATNLVVEGTSDFIYLTELSRYLKQLDRLHLDLRWTITPVGGASGVPTFVALLGSHLNVTVLVDADAKINQRLTGMVAKGILQAQRLITVGQIIGQTRADIEDLFAVEEYLTLYNKAFGTALRSVDLAPNGPIVKRIEKAATAYDHGIPAGVLLRESDSVLKSLSEETLKRFERLFELVNHTLPT